MNRLSLQKEKIISVMESDLDHVKGGLTFTGLLCTHPTGFCPSLAFKTCACTGPTIIVVPSVNCTFHC